MCLFSKKDKPIKCRVNLTCYKVFKVEYGIDKKYDEFFTPFVKKKLEKKGGDVSGVVFESDKCLSTNRMHFLDDYNNIEAFIIREGFVHTFKNIEDARECISKEYFPKLEFGSCEGYEIFECVIPKGVEYYRGYSWCDYKKYVGFASKKVKIIKRLS